MESTITAEQLNCIDLITITDDQIAEIIKRLEAVSDKELLESLILCLIDRYGLISSDSVTEQESQNSIINNNIQKILKSSCLSKCVDDLLSAWNNEQSGNA